MRRERQFNSSRDSNVVRFVGRESERAREREREREYETGRNDRRCLLRCMRPSSEYQYTRATDCLDGPKDDTDVLSSLDSRRQADKGITR